MAGESPIGDTSTVVPAAVREALGDIEVGQPWKLAGGAMHDSWAVDAKANGPTRELVVRVSPAGRADHAKTVREFEVLKTMWARGVRVPEPLSAGEAPAGESYLVMARIAGDANPRRLLTEPGLAAARGAIIDQLAEALAAIHKAVPADVHAELRLPEPGEDPLAAMRRQVEDDYHLYLLNPHPAIEWAFRWMDRKLATMAPQERPIHVVHGDFRVGNLMYDEAGLAAVIDWEGVHAGELEEDISWFCTRVWRFGKNDLEAGGLVPREAWVRAYERASGVSVDRERLAVWEVLQNIRWAEITMMQAKSHLDAQVRNHELAAIGRRTGDTELEILRLAGVTGANHAG